MMHTKEQTLKAACLTLGIMTIFLGEVCLAGQGTQWNKTYSDSAVKRIVFGTVEDVERNLIKVDKDVTEGISPRYLDLSKVKKKDSLKKGDRVKMEVNNFNIVTDYWIIPEKRG